MAIYGEHSAFNGDFDPNSSLMGGGSFPGSSSFLNSFWYDPSGGGDGSGGNPGPTTWQSIKNWFSNLFGGKGTKTTTSIAGAVGSSTIIVGEVSPVGQAFTLQEIMASLEGLGTGVLSTAGMTAGAILYPAMIKEPEFNWTRGIPLAVPVNVTTTTTDDSPEQTMTLFRGVHAKHPDLANAYMGMAIPWGGPFSAQDHNLGKNNSMFTSWSKSIDVANYSASRRGPGGIILKQTFPVSRLSFFDRHGEGEVQVFGPVMGAQIITPWNGGNWTPYIR